MEVEYRYGSAVCKFARYPQPPTLGALYPHHLTVPYPLRTWDGMRGCWVMGDGLLCRFPIGLFLISKKILRFVHPRSDQDVPFPALRHCGLRFGGCRRGPGCRQGTVHFCWDMPSMFLLFRGASKHAYPKRITTPLPFFFLITPPLLGHCP